MKALALKRLEPRDLAELVRRLARRVPRLVKGRSADDEDPDVLELLSAGSHGSTGSP